MEIGMVMEAKAGRRTAADSLIARYQPRIETFIRNFFRSPHELEDLVQEVFLSAFANLTGLREPGKFKSWLYQIAWRVCLQAARQRKMDRAKMLQATVIAPPGSVEAPRIPLETAIPDLLERLSPTDRLIVWLRYVDDVSHGEIATLLDMNESAVRQRACRALGFLREVIE